jgi:branched-chain amino acid transport system ATP-binding protein
VLRVERLDVELGGAQVLHAVDLHVDDGEVAALIGSNGAGKTTLLRTVCGLLAPSRGSIAVAGRSVIDVPAFELARRGIRYVPADRRLFPALSVRDNLALGAYPARPARDRYEIVFGLFPRLRERRSQAVGTMSGGEQQMVALGRALMSSPRVLLLDEPSTGLAPALAEEAYAVLARLRDEGGLTVLVAEQQVHLALGLAARTYVLEHGAVTLEGPSGSLRDHPDVRRAYLGFA